MSLDSRQFQRQDSQGQRLRAEVEPTISERYCPRSQGHTTRAIGDVPEVWAITSSEAGRDKLLALLLRQPVIDQLSWMPRDRIRDSVEPLSGHTSNLTVSCPKVLLPSSIVRMSVASPALPSGRPTSLAS